MAHRYLPWGLTLALGMGVLPWTAPEVRAHDDRPVGWIIFHAGQAGKHRIVWTEVLGARQQDLTPGAPGVGNPSFPAGGDQVAFQREGDIWALYLQSGQAVNLTRTPTYEGCPWFSGDGTQIAFDGIRDDRSEIFLMAADGGGVRQLSKGPGNNACPAFSPDGKLIAFVSDRDGQMEIYLLDLKTGSETRLTDHPAADMDPALSPDGSRIAFTSDRRGKLEIYEMGVDRSGLRRLTEAQSFDIQPVYSPDGRWIAFEQDGNIAAVHRDTGKIRRVTQGAEYKGGPAWGPAHEGPR